MAVSSGVNALPRSALSSAIKSYCCAVRINANLPPGNAIDGCGNQRIQKCGAYRFKSAIGNPDHVVAEDRDIRHLPTRNRSDIHRDLREVSRHRVCPENDALVELGFE